MTTTIAALTPEDIDARLDALTRILVDTVDGGAAVSFMAPLPEDDARRFWLESVRPDVAAGGRRLFAAEIDGATLGVVQLVTATPPNQPHRCEIAKMLVHPRGRRRGLARALMRRAIAEAQALGKTLVTLDTRTGDPAQDLYRSLGFEAAGEIPDFALDPNGRGRHPTTYMYLRLAEREAETAAATASTATARARERTPIAGLSHMTFVVKDLDAMARFMCEGLGAEEIYDSGPRGFSLSREKFFDLAGLWIVAMEGDAPLAPSYRHVAFAASAEALPAMERRLRAIGVRFREPRGRVEGEGASLYFHDFEGHLFEIHAGDREARLARYARGDAPAGPASP